MAKLLSLRTFTDARGNLSVVEDSELPFPIKRLFYIYGVDKSDRGGHRHKTTSMALISLRGSCKADVNEGSGRDTYVLDHPNSCLILEPKDWHLLYDFAPGTIVLACASRHFDESDYIFEEYKKHDTVSRSAKDK